MATVRLMAGSGLQSKFQLF